MINPLVYVRIAATAVVLSGLGYTHWKSWDLGRTHERGVQAEVIAQSVKDAATASMKEGKRRATLAAKITAAEAKSAEARRRGQENANQTGRPECSSRPDDVRLFNDAVDAANLPGAS